MMEPISVVILCGGQSKRMGKDKASLLYRNQTFLQCLTTEFSDSDELFLSVGSQDTYLSYPATHIIDTYQNCGPLGGIHRALSCMHHQWLFTVGCDMPLMDSLFVEKLYQQKKGDPDVIVPLDESGKRHVVGALYQKRILPVLEAQLASGNYRLMDLLGQLQVQYVKVDGYENQRKLTNINHPEAYQQLLQEDIPVICFSGYSNSGKTTMVEKVIKKLSEKGVRVTYLKHSHHTPLMSDTHHDTERMYLAGARETIVMSDVEVIRHQREAVEVERILREVRDTDLIVMEGWKEKEYPKIWVVSVTDDIDALMKRHDIVAWISNQSIVTNQPVFSSCDEDALCDWLAVWMKGER